VAVGVVDLLEVIQVDQPQHEAPRCGATGLCPSLERRLEVTAVRDPGQRIQGSGDLSSGQGSLEGRDALSQVGVERLVALLLLHDDPPDLAHLLRELLLERSDVIHLRESAHPLRSARELRGKRSGLGSHGREALGEGLNHAAVTGLPCLVKGTAGSKIAAAGVEAAPTSAGRVLSVGRVGDPEAKAADLLADGMRRSLPVLGDHAVDQLEERVEPRLEVVVTRPLVLPPLE
jgi:hypothetical protein